MTIAVGYIGSGLSFKVFHFPFTSAVKDFTPTALFVNSAKSKAAIQEDATYKALKLYSESDEQLQEMINSVDLVIICSPPGSHLAHMQRCVDSKKHCIVEKPISGDMESAKAILALSQTAKEAGLVASVFQNRRYDSNYLSLKKLIREGTLGRIVAVKSRMDRWRPQPKAGNHWREDPSQGGLLLDLGSHLVDQMFALYGKPSTMSSVVKSQRSETAVAAKQASNDSFSITMNYDDPQKPIVTVESGSLVSCPHHRFEVHGTKGSWTVDGEDSQEAAIKGGASPLDEGFGKHPCSSDLYLAQEDGTISHKDMPVETGTWIQYYKDIADSISHNAPIQVLISDAVSCLEILLEAGASTL